VPTALGLLFAFPPLELAGYRISYNKALTYSPFIRYAASCWLRALSSPRLHCELIENPRKSGIGRVSPLDFGISRDHIGISARKLLILIDRVQEGVGTPCRNLSFHTLSVGIPK
jgi:hypothetical protein